MKFWGKERPVIEPPRPTAVSQEDASRESTIQYLVADTRRLPTIDDLCGELGCLPMFKGLDPGAKREFASQIMSLRQQKDNPVAKKE